MNEEDFNNEEAANKLRSNVFMQGFLSELDNDMQPKEIGKLYERAKEVLSGEYLEKIRDKIQDKMKGFEGASSNSSAGASRNSGMSNQAPQTKQQTNNSQGSAAPSGKHTEFDQYGRIKNRNYSNIKASVIDKLCERNVPDEELDKILEMTRRMAGMSAEELRQAETNAAAKKGNQGVTYNDVSLPKGYSISDKLEEVRMMAHCRESLTNPTINMYKLQDYFKYKGTEDYQAYDYMELEYYTATKGIPRAKEDAARKARIAAKLVENVLKNNPSSDKQTISGTIENIVRANPNLALWGATAVKKYGLTAHLPDNLGKGIDFDIYQLGDKKQDFKNALAYDMVDRASDGESKIEMDLNYIFSETTLSPKEKLSATKTYLDNNDYMPNKYAHIYDSLQSIAAQGAQYVPTVMSLLSHRTFEKSYNQLNYYGFNDNDVLRTCLEQDPKLLTQELYNRTRNRPDADEYNVITYMDSVNPKLKENWQKSGRNMNNFRSNSAVNNRRDM
ncbi:MAG: hypothetical protein J6N45_08890 [Alphaproteobacteria bacterium]|nr:hypothetical protein [Alphaproteobacteria bacterium]